MNVPHLGFYNTSSSRTFVRVLYSTHAAAGGNVAPSSSIDAADIRIYRAADGAAFSATQRSSSSGITSTSPFDSLTGFHEIDIDLTDNTDSGFYAAGYLYAVVLAPSDETIDSQTITGVALAYFEIGVPTVNVTQFGGTAGTFSSGRPEVNTTHAAGTAWTSGAITSSALATDCFGSGQLAASAVTEIWAAVADSAGVTTLLSRLSSARAGYLDNINNSNLASVPAFPSNFASLGINASGHISRVTLADTVTTLTNAPSDSSGITTLLSRLSSARAGYLDNLSAGAVALASGVTVTTNNDKTGYALTSAYDAAKTAAQAGDAMTLADGAITAAKIATDAIGSDQLAASAVSEIAAGAADTSGVTTLLSRLSSARAGYLDNLSAGAVALASGVTVTTNNDKTGYALSAAGFDPVIVESSISASAALANDAGTQLTSINGRQSLSLILSGLAGVLAGAATTNITTKPAGKPSGNARIDATVDASGNRSSITLKVPT